MSDPRTFHFQLPRDGRPPHSSLDERAHPDFHWLTSHRARSRRRDVFEVIDTVVVHATAGFATAHAIDAWKTRQASAHWVIPDEDEAAHGRFVWATVGEAKAAYHVANAVDPVPHLGAGPDVNSRSLGIELVNAQGVNGTQDPYSDWQVLACARIVLYAWAKYPNLRHVISHAKLDPGRRTDPGPGFPWERFKAMVLGHGALPPGVEAPEPPERRETAPVEQAGNCCGP